MKFKALWLGCILLIGQSDAFACVAHRSQTAKRQFVRANACPVADLPAKGCTGWVIDHRIPLCAGGKDVPSNMQWSLLGESRGKDTEERALCRQIRLKQIKKSSNSTVMCKRAKAESWTYLEKATCGN